MCYRFPSIAQSADRFIHTFSSHRQPANGDSAVCKTLKINRKKP